MIDSGCAGEEKEMQTEAGVGGPHQAWIGKEAQYQAASSMGVDRWGTGTT